MLPRSATLCRQWQHSQCTIILPSGAIRSCHSMRRVSIARSSGPRLRGEHRSEQPGSKAGFARYPPRNPEYWSSSVQLKRSVSESAMKLSLRFAVAETSLWPATQQEPKRTSGSCFHQVRCPPHAEPSRPAITLFRHPLTRRARSKTRGYGRTRPRVETDLGSHASTGSRIGTRKLLARR
jgi:hypothetical protein